MKASADSLTASLRSFKGPRKAREPSQIYVSAADVVDNLSSRHGQIQSQEARGGSRIIRARVPMSRMLSYATDLRERTHGQATCSLHFERYERIQSGPDEGDRDAMVGAPLKPAPTINRAAIALPEPDDDALSG